MKKLWIHGEGTWSREANAHRTDEEVWFKPNSWFDKMLQRRGYQRMFDEDYITWSGEMDGTTFQAVLPGKVNKDWLQGGMRLYAHCRYRILTDQPDEILMIGHSHGGQVCLYAICALNHWLFKEQPELRDKVKIKLVTIDTPRNVSMHRYYETANELLGGNWIHLFSKFFTRIRILGTGAILRPWDLFRRGMPNAENVNTGGGHSDWQRPENEHLWDSIDFEEMKYKG